MQETEIHRWMRQFATKKSITKFIKEKTIAYHPESLILEKALSMYTCSTFKAEKKCLIHPESLIFKKALSMYTCPTFKAEEKFLIKDIVSATFSADSLHLVTTGVNNARIYGQDSSGEWVLKTIINHPDNRLISAIFSPDDSHVITIGDKAKIHGKNSSNEWIEKATIQYPGGYGGLGTFSANSHHAMFFSSTRATGSTVQIYGRDSNGNWTQSAIIHNAEYQSATAIFSPNSHNVLITLANDIAQIYKHDSSDGTWTKKAAPESNSMSLLGTFSTDDSHLALTHDDSATGIYRQNLNGQWTKKILIHDGTNTLENIFSNDGRFVMITSDDGKAVTICGQSSSGEWTEKATIQHKKRVYLMTFSSDSCHVATSDYDGVVQIYSKMGHDKWIKKVTTQYKGRVRGKSNHASVAFSADNRHMLTSNHAHSTVTIYSWAPNGEWTENCILNLRDDTISETTFSTDGYHVLISSFDNPSYGFVKIYGLDSTDNQWKEKAHITHNGATTARISADCSHVVTLNGDSNITKIWRLSRDRHVFCSPSPCKKMKLS